MCIPKSSIRELFVKEFHEGINETFWDQKTLDMLHDNFFLSCMKHVSLFVIDACKCAKFKSMIFMSFHVPNSHWTNIPIDFVLGLLRSKGGKKFVFVIVEKFSKMVNSIPCHKNDDANHVANFFFNLYFL